MIDEFAKNYLHGELREVRESLVWKLEGLPEYDVRRPLTYTGTNLLGLVKHLTITEAQYFGAVFDRPFPERLTWWDSDEPGVDSWATADESRAEVVDRYHRACRHADETINALDLDSRGHVPWWPHPDVMLVNVLVHLVVETNRHAGHADILREQLDGSTGIVPSTGDTPGNAYWEARYARLEQAARDAAGPITRSSSDQGSRSRPR